MRHFTCAKLRGVSRSFPKYLAGLRPWESSLQPRARTAAKSDLALRVVAQPRIYNHFWRLRFCSKIGTALQMDRKAVQVSQ
jgi:hypothetical protein